MTLHTNWLDWRCYHRKMKLRERDRKPEQSLSSDRGMHLLDSGLDIETKIFSAFGPGRGLFLTSLFIEPIAFTPPESNVDARTRINIDVGG